MKWTYYHNLQGLFFFSRNNYVKHFLYPANLADVGWVFLNVKHISTLLILSEHFSRLSSISEANECMYSFTVENNLNRFDNKVSLALLICEKALMKPEIMQFIMSVYVLLKI